MLSNVPLVRPLDIFVQVWHKVVKELNINKESYRFFTLEARVYNIFFKTEINGIRVSRQRLLSKLEELTIQQYTATKALELDYNFVSQRIKPNLNWEDISSFCKLKSIKEELNHNFWNNLNIFSEHDPFLSCLLSARNASMDFSTLLKYTVDQYEPIYPRYDVMGTVTGRILISSPGIQYLKRTSRSIFTPTEGQRFIYADFAQFEPGIIAALSDDAQLLKAYNDGDVYEQLSHVLFNSEDQRKICKVIFLAYIYGMSKDRLSGLIGEIAGQEKVQQGLSFFEKFVSLCKWKDKLCDNATDLGYATSIMGNKRYLDSVGSINTAERRWVPNQMIQGTASVIFKKSIVRLATKLPQARFLVPMHDGILLEVPEAEHAEAQAIVNKELTAEFHQACQNIKVGVSFEEFAA